MLCVMLLLTIRKSFVTQHDGTVGLVLVEVR